ncbi:MAG: hypothetical protein H6735_33720, partial [Alphaproteobacteria bacterium]|nr:hypothetical protein [Alphaproteobacteria bacterium]
MAPEEGKEEAKTRGPTSEAPEGRLHTQEPAEGISSTSARTNPPGDPPEESGYGRSGLRIVTRRGRKEVGEAILRYAPWLRREVEFPMRVPVYLSPRRRLRTMHGELVSASFFAPYDPLVEPYIRIATGDFDELL